MKYIECLKNSLLFKGISYEDVEELVASDKAEIVEYDKDEVIFNQGERPEKLFILLDGSVVVANNSYKGIRSVVATINRKGEMFGEVYLFLEKEEYDNYAQAATKSKILLLYKDFFISCNKPAVAEQITTNLLFAMANKAYYLNKRLQVTSSIGIRQKLARVLIQHYHENGTVPFSMRKEDLASYISATRPSVSRELIKMKDEGIIDICGREITITDYDNLLSLR